MNEDAIALLWEEIPKLPGIARPRPYLRQNRKLVDMVGTDLTGVPKVYVAGKCTGQDWREISEDPKTPHERDYQEDMELAPRENFPEWDRYAFYHSRGFVYVGPFPNGMGHCRSGKHDNSNSNVNDSLFRNCLRAIERCDVFVAVITSLDCFGTLTEIGYAKAHQKFIAILIDQRLADHEQDLWFVKRMGHFSGMVDLEEHKAMHYVGLTVQEAKKSHHLRGFWTP